MGAKSEGYVAPEILLGTTLSKEEKQAMSEKGDIYAIGITVYEVIKNQFCSLRHLE